MTCMAIKENTLEQQETIKPPSASISSIWHLTVGLVLSLNLSVIQTKQASLQIQKGLTSQKDRIPPVM